MFDSASGPFAGIGVAREFLTFERGIDLGERKGRIQRLGLDGHVDEIHVPKAQVVVSNR